MTLDNSNLTNIISMWYRNVDINPSLVVETRIYIFYWCVDVVRSWFMAITWINFFTLLPG